MALLIISKIKHSFHKIAKENNLRVFSILNTKDTLYADNSKDHYLLKKFNELNDWYVKLTGLDEVKRLQDKVIYIQERLEKAQEERREIGKLLVDIRKRSVEIQEQLTTVKRWEDSQRFLDLMKTETEIIREEKSLTEKFEVLDQAERELFTSLSNAVRDSHEKEKAQSEYTKYWGIILSIIGTIIGAIISTIISTMRNKQLVNGINKGVDNKFEEITNMLNKEKINDFNIDKVISQIRHENRAFSKLVLEKLSDTDKLTKDLKTENLHFSNEILRLLKDNNSELQNKEKFLLSVDNVRDGDKYINVENFIEAQKNLIYQQQKEIRIVGLILGVVGLVTFFAVSR